LELVADAAACASSSKPAATVCALYFISCKTLSLFAQGQDDLRADREASYLLLMCVYRSQSLTLLVNVSDDGRSLLKPLNAVAQLDGADNPTAPSISLFSKTASFSCTRMADAALRVLEPAEIRNTIVTACAWSSTGLVPAGMPLPRFVFHAPATYGSSYRFPGETTSVD
jgi:hypothetical protein